jgi:hypothetical protein
VVEVAEERVELPPETLDRDSRLLIRGVHRLGRRLMHVLDAEGAITPPPVEGD